ncbi:MAG: porin family protein [Elusimicrobiota bacterium]
MVVFNLNMKKFTLKKIFLAVVFLIGIFNSAFIPDLKADFFTEKKFAQNTKFDSEPKPRIGMKMGMSISDLIGHENNNIFIDYDSRLTFTGGFFLDIPLGNIFAIQLESLYYQKGIKKTDRNETGGGAYTFEESILKLDYYEAPLLLHINVAPSMEYFIPSVYFGPSVGMVARAVDDHFYKEVDTDGNTTTKNRTITNIEKDMKELDTSVVVGLGFKSTESKFSSDIRATFSVESPFKAEREVFHPAEKVEKYKNGLISILIGYSF